jgi:hypothetical protein
MDHLKVGLVMIFAIGVIATLLWYLAQKVIEFERRGG